MSAPPSPTLRRALGLGLGLGIAVALIALARWIDRPLAVPTPPPAAKAGTGTPAAPTDPALVLGVWPVSDVQITDGDSLRLADGTRVRVLGLDCEELYRSESERRAAGEDFARYAREQRAESPRPVKFGTPAGEAAREAGRRLLDGSERVRLERDDLGLSDRDTFGRLLAHAILDDGLHERLFAAEMIRGGHSPYFVKYGRHHLHDAALTAAEAEARLAKRGIWGTEGPAHYPDYPERLRWWHARAAQVDRWRKAPASPDRVALDAADADDRLRASIGTTATVFGPLRATKSEGRPRILWLQHRPRNDFAVVVFEDEVWQALDHAALQHRYATVTGRVTLFRDRPQIIVTDTDQVSTR